MLIAGDAEIEGVLFQNISGGLRPQTGSAHIASYEGSLIIQASDIEKLASLPKKVAMSIKIIQGKQITPASGRVIKPDEIAIYVMRPRDF